VLVEIWPGDFGKDIITPLGRSWQGRLLRGGSINGSPDEGDEGDDGNGGDGSDAGDGDAGEDDGDGENDSNGNGDDDGNSDNNNGEFFGGDSFF
jgi:hypothetical protein